MYIPIGIVKKTQKTLCISKINAREHKSINIK